MGVHVLKPWNRTLQPAVTTMLIVQQPLLENPAGRYCAEANCSEFSRNLCLEDPFSIVTVTLAVVT